LTRALIRRKKMKKIVKNIGVFLVVYTIVIFIAFLMYLFKLFGRLKILHWERFPTHRSNSGVYKNGLIVVSNHISLLEPLMLPALFYQDYLPHPIKFIPYSVPDRKNYDRWFWFWARARMIYVERGNPREELRAFQRIKKVLNAGKIVIIFPEGTRTFKAKSYSYSAGGKKIGHLEEGIAYLILKTGATVLPIWVEGADEFFPNTIWAEGQKSKFPFPRFWKKVTVKVGKPVKFEKTNKTDIIQKVANTLLELADE